MMHATMLTVAAASLLLAACGDNSGNEPGTSDFAGEITGAHTTSVSGEALFGVTLDDGSRAVGLALILGEGGAARIFLASTTTPRPLIGTYDVERPGFPGGNDTVFAGTVGLVVNGALEGYETRSGTITLTRSGYNGVAGNFQLRAVRTSPCCDTTSVQIFISGTFDAAQISQLP
jgi:hypothetical protein